MDLGIRGRAAVVIGGSRGLGYASARELAAEGVRVMIAARNQERLDEAVGEIAVEGGEVAGVSADCLTAEGVDKAFAAARERYGEIDILVYSPSVSIHGWFEDVGEAEFAWGNASMVTLFAHMARSVLPHMKTQRWGRIVVIGSCAVKAMQRRLPRTVPMAYRMANAALCKSLSDEYGPYGITVNTVAPGPFATELFVRLFERQAADTGKSYEEVHAERTSDLPLRRMGRPEELGSTVAFLCSERGGFITGQQIMIDGGSSPAIL